MDLFKPCMNICQKGNEIQAFGLDSLLRFCHRGWPWTSTWSLSNACLTRCVSQLLPSLREYLWSMMGWKQAPPYFLNTSASPGSGIATLMLQQAGCCSLALRPFSFGQLPPHSGSNCTLGLSSLTSALQIPTTISGGRHCSYIFAS